MIQIRHLNSYTHGHDMEKSMRRILILIILCGVAQIMAAEEPRLSGTWTLNLAKSNLAGEHLLPDYGLTWTIEQNAPRLILVEKATNASFANIQVPDTETRLEIKTDGQEAETVRKSNLPRATASTAVIKAEWQGNTLLITERGSGWGGTSISCRRLYLSKDGSELIELLEVHSPMLDSEERLVFERVK